jgi:hypothetical protein
MNAEQRNQLYLRVNRERWLRVAKAVAEARGIAENTAEMKTVRKEVFEARYEIAFTAKSIVPKAPQIEDYHHLIASTPPIHMITRRHFEGLRPREAARLVKSHLISGKPATEIAPVVAPYFERRRPRQHLTPSLAS